MAKGGGKKGKPGAASGVGRTGWSRKNFAPVIFLSIELKPGSGVFEPADDLLEVLMDFKHKEVLTKATETHFKFRNDNIELAEDPRFLGNTYWKFRFGYYDDLSPIMVGIVRSIEPDYADKCTINVQLFDSSLSASQTSSSKKWGTIKSSEIAKALAKKHGWKTVVEDSRDLPKKAWIQPSDLSDLQLLRDMAAQIDFEVSVDGDPPTLFYRKKQYDVPAKGAFIYYDDPSEYSYLKSFKPKVHSLGPLATGVKGTDAEKGKGDKAASVDASKTTPGLAPKSNLFVQSVFSDKDAAPAVSVIAVAVSSAAPAAANTQKLAAVARSQILDKCNEASSDHPLTPALSKGFIFEIHGIEKPLEGKWYAQEVDHEINGTGATTKVVWKRNALGGKKDVANTNNKTPAGTANTNPIVQTTFDGVTGNGTATVIARGNPPIPPAELPKPVPH